MSTPWKQAYDRMPPWRKLCYHAREANFGGYPSYTAEVGSYKPWDNRTITAAVKRGMLDVLRKEEGFQVIQLTRKGKVQGEKDYDRLLALLPAGTDR